MPRLRTDAGIIVALAHLEPAIYVPVDYRKKKKEQNETGIKNWIISQNEKKLENHYKKKPQQEQQMKPPSLQRLHRHQMSEHPTERGKESVSCDFII